VQQEQRTREGRGRARGRKAGHIDAFHLSKAAVHVYRSACGTLAMESHNFLKRAGARLRHRARPIAGDHDQSGRSAKSAKLFPLEYRGKGAISNFYRRL